MKKGAPIEAKGLDELRGLVEELGMFAKELCNDGTFALVILEVEHKPIPLVMQTVH